MRFILDEAVGEQERDRYESGKKGELSFGWWKIYLCITSLLLLVVGKAKKDRGK